MNNHSQAEQDLAHSRIDQWHSTVQAELQSLIKQASSIRKNIDEAKTAYKKQYYAKKFDKVQKDVMSMVMTLQRLEQRKASMAEVVSPVVEEVVSQPINSTEPVSDAIVRNVADLHNPPTWS